MKKLLAILALVPLLYAGSVFASNGSPAPDPAPQPTDLTPSQDGK